MVKAAPLLRNKEDVNFSEALKLYDAKQYKKALKLVEQNLKKNSNHAELLTLKGCIFFNTGNKAEAEAYIVKGTTKEPTNYLVDHLAGIYYRGVDNYELAAKWLKASIDNGSPNKQILRDLGINQAQIRDYKGLLDSRQQYLEHQPGYRANWTGVALAHHLNKNYNSAVSTLAKIEGIIKEHLQESDRYEQSECVLYKNLIIAEAGNFAEALKVLDADDLEIRDKLSVLEYRAHYLMCLGQSKEASLVYRKLLQRNPENVLYYRLLELTLGLQPTPEDSKIDTRLKLYRKLASFYPRSDPPKFLPLTFVPASHPEFTNLVNDYVLDQLKRGVPATFVNVKPLYKDKAKGAAIESVVLQFYKDQAKLLGPTVVVWTAYFLAQHFLHLKDLQKATEYIDFALDHTPTLVELYIVKARILKHLGNLEEAANTMNAGRKLDLQDRFINSKATKYMLRANKVDEGIDCISLFTKLDEGSVNGCKDLHLMQATWVLIESAEAYARLYHEYKQKLEEANGNEEEEAELQEKTNLYLGLALKRFSAVLKIFKIFYDDQYDFHSYCLRRGTPRDYVDMLRWEDRLHSTPVYVRCVKGLAGLYMEIDQEKKQKAGKDNLKSVKKKKKNQKKQLESLAAKVESEKDDADPFGASIVANLFSDKEDILEKLLQLIKPLTTEAGNFATTWELSYQANLKKRSYIAAVQAIKKLNTIIGSDGKPKKAIGDKVVETFNTVKQDTTVVPAIPLVVEKTLVASFPELANGVDAVKGTYVN